MHPHPLVRLWEFKGVGLILFWPSGVFYSNQTSGYSCDHPEIEGVFAPLLDEASPAVAALDEHFYNGPKWRGYCNAGIDGETADFLDTLLAQFEETRFLKTDRSKFKLCREAWIWVECDGVDSWSVLGIPAGGGVLTWENSD